MKKLFHKGCYNLMVPYWLASEIFQIAAGYQSQASDTCITSNPCSNSKYALTVTEGRLSILASKKPVPGISKGKTLLAKMSTKKEKKKGNRQGRGNSGPLCEHATESPQCWTV